MSIKRQPWDAAFGGSSVIEQLQSFPAHTALEATQSELLRETHHQLVLRAADQIRHEYGDEVTRTELAQGTVAYEFTVDAVMLIQEVTYLTSGNPSVADDILQGLLHDPNGPRIDLRKALREHLGTRVKLTCDFQTDGTLDYVVEMGLIDPAAFLPTFRRVFTSEPRYMANESMDFYAIMLPATNEAEKTERWGAAVVGQQLYWGSLDKVEAMRNK